MAPHQRLACGVEVEHGDGFALLRGEDHRGRHDIIVAVRRVLQGVGLACAGASAQ